MKRVISICCVVLLLVVCGACRQAPAEPNADALQLRLVDGAGTAQLVLAGEQSGDVYTVGTDSLTVFLDGEAAAVTDLENGMLLTFDAGYTVLETWPGQLTGATAHAQRAPGDKTDHGDLCGLYLQVLEDLWANDEALNEDVTYISVDLDDAPGGLTDGEKAAITWIFSGRHQAQGLQYSLDDLSAEGYIDAGALYWKDGVLLCITATKDTPNTAKKLTFDAEKWRSGTGAIFFNNCTAKRGKGVQWKPYQPGGFAIS